MPTLFLGTNVQHAFLTSICYVILIPEHMITEAAFFHSWLFMKLSDFLTKYILAIFMNYNHNFGYPLLCLGLRFATIGRASPLPEG